jgi:hypothetical protein
VPTAALSRLPCGEGTLKEDQFATPAVRIRVFLLHLRFTTIPATPTHPPRAHVARAINDPRLARYVPPHECCAECDALPRFTAGACLFFNSDTRCDSLPCPPSPLPSFLRLTVRIADNSCVALPFFSHARRSLSQIPPHPTPFISRSHSHPPSRERKSAFFFYHHDYPNDKRTHNHISCASSHITTTPLRSPTEINRRLAAPRRRGTKWQQPLPSLPTAFAPWRRNVPWRRSL